MKTGQEDARLSPVLWSFMELQHYSIWRNMLCALPVADEMVNPGRFNPHTGSKSCNMVGNVLPVTRWLILSSAYKFWQSMMVSHRAVDQLHSWASSILIDESQLLNWSTALWDTIMDCQGWNAELAVNHLVTRRPPRSVMWQTSYPCLKCNWVYITVHLQTEKKISKGSPFLLQADDWKNPRQFWHAYIMRVLCPSNLETFIQIGIDIHKCSPVTWETSTQSTHNTQCMVIVFPHTNCI